MSMKIQPAVDTGFLIDHEVAAYIILAADKRHDSVPKEIQEILDAGTFASRAKEGDLPEDYSFPAVAYECFEDGICYFAEFDGEVTTMFPEKAISPIEWNCDNDRIYYMPTERGADLFKAAYTGPNEVLKEFRGTLKAMRIDFPGDFDWWARIVNITGTSGV